MLKNNSHECANPHMKLIVQNHHKSHSITTPPTISYSDLGRVIIALRAHERLLPGLLLQKARFSQDRKSRELCANQLMLDLRNSMLLFFFFFFWPVICTGDLCLRYGFPTPSLSLSQCLIDRVGWRAMWWLWGFFLQHERLARAMRVSMFAGRFIALPRALSVSVCMLGEGLRIFFLVVVF